MAEYEIHMMSLDLRTLESPSYERRHPSQTSDNTHLDADLFKNIVHYEPMSINIIAYIIVIFHFFKVFHWKTVSKLKQVVYFYTFCRFILCIVCSLLLLYHYHLLSQILHKRLLLLPLPYLLLSSSNSSSC